MDKNEYQNYSYSEEKVNKYIEKQTNLNRKALAIIYDDEIIGEIVIKNIENNKCATISISLKNSKYKGKGFGTKAGHLAIRYVFNELDIPVLYTDTILTNTRSQHVLKKIGFRFLKEEGCFKYYCIERCSDGKYLTNRK